MPTFFQKEPPEFRQFYDGQRWINATQLKNASESGVIGAPAADVDTFNKIVSKLRRLNRNWRVTFPHSTNSNMTQSEQSLAIQQIYFRRYLRFKNLYRPYL